jgi:hypothetical protein
MLVAVVVTPSADAHTITTLTVAANEWKVCTPPPPSSLPETDPQTPPPAPPSPAPLPARSPAPPPAPAPAQASSGSVLFNGDFETGGLGQWSSVRRVAEDRLFATQSTVRQGSTAARVENPGR